MIVRWMTRVICAVALTLIAFAHQTPTSVAAAASVHAALAAYALPDGAIPFICASGDADRGKSHGKSHMHGCDACRISASVCLSGPAGDIGAAVFDETNIGLLAMLDFPRKQIVPPEGRPRAPPRDRIAA